MALRRGFSASARSRTVSISSTGDSFFLAIISTSLVAGEKLGSYSSKVPSPGGRGKQNSRGAAPATAPLSAETGKA